MNPKQYVKDAIRTESIVSPILVNDRFVFQAVVDMFVACATLLDQYKKNIYYHKPINEDKWFGAINAMHGAIHKIQQSNPNEQENIDTLDIDSRILHAIIGIATESGELMEAVRANLGVHDKLDNVNLQEEVGDLNWYEAILIDALGADWDDIREKNIAKLKARYPNKFDPEDAINRNLKAERKILEGGDARARAEEGYPFGGSDY